ncbi:hypothetical protein BDR04DRAFT_1115532 [Suillus decipiens]|nr:hypothetical protein BDR04DRAFT_1115532 [Suillus decipiens]
MSGQFTADDPHREKKVGENDRYDKRRNVIFRKMKSIKEHYAAKRGTPSNVGPAGGPAQITGKTHKLSVVEKKDRVRLRPVSKKVIPRGVGNDNVQKYKCSRIDIVEAAASSHCIASQRNDAGSVSFMGTKTSITGKLRSATTGTTGAGTSTFMAPTASSLAKTRKLPVPPDVPFRGKDKAKPPIPPDGGHALSRGNDPEADFVT